MAETGFSAEKEIPASDVPVTNNRAVITPSSEDPEGKKIQATINFNIDGVAPVKMTDAEEDRFWKWAIPIAGRAPNLKNVSPTITAVSL